MAYQIKPGDTLTAIARANNASLDDILRANPTIKDANRIFAGGYLELPSASAPAANTGAGSAGTGTGNGLGTDYSKVASNAGATGVGVKDFAELLGATPEEQQLHRDNLAKELGYDGYGSLTKELFTKPSQSTQQFYEQAYNAAGLDQKLAEITAKKQKLNEALGTVNDNPWYDEAYRRGEAARLQNMANADIKSLEEEYNLRHGRVKDLVSTHATDLGSEEKLREARFNYLENALKERLSNVGSERAKTYFNDYATGKQSVEKPKTVSVGPNSTLYEWDSTNQTFVPALQRNTPAPGTPGTPPTPTRKSVPPKPVPPKSTNNKVVTAFNKALGNRNVIDKAGSREQFIRQLQAQFPEIHSEDIARKVYETYPDHFDGQ
jgi:LysM repeat protein